MSVKTTHRDYDKFAPKWKRCRDAVAGQDAIHAAGESYLPKLKDETADDYAARLKRSDFFNGTWRTIDGLGGMAFRKAPTVEVPAGIEGHLADVNMAGADMDALAAETVEDVLSVGRIGILVDHPTMPDNVTAITLDAAEKLGLRPTLQVYATESIINWKFARINNAWVLRLVVLKEVTTVADGEFKEKAEDRYRVLDLDGAGQYRQRLFRIDDKGGDEQIGEDLYPLMNNAPLTFIPFAIIGTGGRGDVIDEPPLIDLVDANLALYQINADYRHGLHFTGLPTAVVSGYSPEKEGEKLYIGSQAAWVFPDPNAKAVYLEFTGQGLDALLAASKEKKQEMALLGARMIADETKQAETLGATQIKRSGENSVLAKIVQQVSTSLEWCLRVFADWAGQPGEIVYQINRDFTPQGMDPQMITALMGAVQAGKFPEEAWFDLAQRADMIDAEMSFEEYQEKVDREGGPVRPDQVTKPKPGEEEDVAA